MGNAENLVLDFLNSEEPIIKKHLSSVYCAAANGKKIFFLCKRKQSDAASDTSSTKEQKKSSLQNKSKIEKAQN